MRSVAIAVALVAAGCGDYDETDYTHSYTVQCRGEKTVRDITFYSFRPDVRVNVLERNVAEATRMLTSGRVKRLTSKDMICDWLTETELVIDRRPYFAFDSDLAIGKTKDCTNNKECLGGVTALCGFSHPEGRITQMRLRDNAIGYTLVHEFLHIWDLHWVNLTTVGHAGWKEKGYLDVADEFSTYVLDRKDHSLVHIDTLRGEGYFSGT